MFSEKSFSIKLVLTILLILLLTVAGCGNKPNNTENSTDQTVTPTTPAPSNPDNLKPGSTTSTAAGVVTYENYLKIKLDTTYDDVKSILGEGTKKDIKTDVIRYTWSEQDNNIVIETNKGKIETKTQSDLGKTTSTLTNKQFKQITNGMTVDQVVSILGPDYREVSYERAAAAIVRSLIWMRPDSKFVKVKLQDDKVTDTYDFL